MPINNALISIIITFVHIVMTWMSKLTSIMMSLDIEANGERFLLEDKSSHARIRFIKKRSILFIQPLQN